MKIVDLGARKDMPKSTDLPVGKEGLEPSRLSAHDPKSCLSANSSTSPGQLQATRRNYKPDAAGRQCKGFAFRVKTLQLNGYDPLGYISGIIRQVTEASVSRVINPESAGKERTQLSRAVVLALRELMRKSEVDEQTRDLAAFIYLALRSIYATIDSSVTAWEKRGYWLKADRFRMEWAWSESLSQALLKAIRAEDWGGVALTAAQVFQKLKDIEVPQRHRLGEPWVGAWKQLESEKR